MPSYDIVITVDLEDDIEAERILDEVQKALHPLPLPDREWTFAYACHAHVEVAPPDEVGESAQHDPEMLGPGGDTLLPPGGS